MHFPQLFIANVSWYAFSPFPYYRSCHLIKQKMTTFYEFDKSALNVSSFLIYYTKINYLKI